MKHGKLAGILWHQGESDARASKVATYAERFGAMIARLRADLNAEDVPVVVGELLRSRSNNAAFNENLPTVVAAVPNSVLVSSEDMVDRGDKIHFDSPSLRTFGERYAAAFLEMRKAA